MSAYNCISKDDTASTKTYRASLRDSRRSSHYGYVEDYRVSLPGLLSLYANSLPRSYKFDDGSPLHFAICNNQVVLGTPFKNSFSVHHSKSRSRYTIQKVVLSTPFKKTFSVHHSKSRSQYTIQKVVLSTPFKKSFSVHHSKSRSQYIIQKVVLSTPFKNSFSVHHSKSRSQYIIQKVVLSTPFKKSFSVHHSKSRSLNPIEQFILSTLMLYCIYRNQHSRSEQGGNKCRHCENIEMESSGDLNRVSVPGAAKVKSMNLLHESSTHGTCVKGMTYGHLGPDAYVDLGCSGRFEICFVEAVLHTAAQGLCNS
ncbi:hypothetical protein RRG08_048853 [Elysia crispata]|uniref:Uncharacterized protein n=1 Tax=Elysia crispata TaxID=231223 RepID=A0AAE1DZM0_9GAST|nr:hypothetical protein RRG08_048853 [Elysia crispata]